LLLTPLAIITPNTVPNITGPTQSFPLRCPPPAYALADESNIAAAKNVINNFFITVSYIGIGDFERIPHNL